MLRSYCYFLGNITWWWKRDALLGPILVVLVVVSIVVIYVLRSVITLAIKYGSDRSNIFGGWWVGLSYILLMVMVMVLIAAESGEAANKKLPVGCTHDFWCMRIL